MLDYIHRVMLDNYNSNINESCNIICGIEFMVKLSSTLMSILSKSSLSETKSLKSPLAHYIKYVIKSFFFFF